MKVQKITEALAAVAARMTEEHTDTLALAVDTYAAVTEWDALAASAATKGETLRAMLTANAVMIAADIATSKRGRQAAMAREIVGESATKTEQNTATKRVGRIAAVGRLLVAHPNSDPLALYTFVNGATGEEIDAACESKGDPTKAAPRKRGTAGPKAGRKGTKAATVREIVEALSKTMKAATDAACECGTVADQEQYLRVLAANVKRIEAALASGVHGDGNLTPATDTATEEEGEEESAA